MSVKYPTFFENEEFKIQIQHIPTREKVEFHSWITGFTDAFNSSWSGTPVYGRMDDLYTFQKTSRVITLAFDVVAANLNEAKRNQNNLNRLTQFLYPVYSNPVAGGSSRENSQVLQAAPLLKMKFNSVIANAGDTGELVGFVNGFTHAPDLTSGQYFANKKSDKNILYQTYSVQLNFTVLHTHLTGWVEKKTTFDPSGNETTHYSFGSADKPRIGQNFPRNQGLAQAPAARLAQAPSFRAGDPPTSVQSLPQEQQDFLAQIEDSTSQLSEQRTAEEEAVTGG